MRKGIFVLCIAVIVIAMVMAAAAKEDTGKKVETPKTVETQNKDKGSDPQGQPFEEIWKAIKDLQVKLNKIELTPGPQGPKGDTGTCSCDVSLQEFNALKARVAALEGGCHPVSETCNGIDDDCDGTPDNGATCGTGQECVNGDCIYSSENGCTEILDCMNTCDNNVMSCMLQCKNSGSAEAHVVFDPLMTCGIWSCNFNADMEEFTACLEQNCAEQWQSCLNSETPVCTPNCAGKVCGSDGCGGSCGTCTNDLVCSGGQCITNPCVPNPCTDPGEPICGDDEASIITPYGVGQCSYYDGVTHCTGYPQEITQCATGQVCKSGQCIAGGDSGDPCVPNPCTTPPEPVCLSEGGIDFVRTYTGEGAVCSSLSGTEFECNYHYGDTSCTTLQHCVNAQCVVKP